MLENNDFDKLFKDGLNDLKSIDNREQQWKVVSQKLKKKSRRNLLWFLPLFLLAAYCSAGLLTSNKSSSDNTVEVNNQLGQNNANSDTDKLSNLTKNKDITNTNEVNQKAAIDKNEVSNPKNNTTTKSSIIKEDFKPELKSSKNVNNLIQNQENDLAGFSSLGTNINKGHSAFEFEKSKIIENKSYTIPNGPEPSNSKYTNELKDQIAELQEIRNSLEFPLLNRRSIFLNTKEKLEIHLIPIKTLNQKSSLKFRIGAGVFYEFLSQDSLTDNASVGFQSNVNLSYSKIQLNLGYKNNKIDRVILSQLGSYNIADTNLIYGYTSPDSTSLTYTNHMLDIAIGYNISPLKWLDWNVQAGISARYIKNGKIIYTYGGAYQPIVNEYEIENPKFQFTNYMLGTGFYLRTYKSIGISIEYNLIMPRDIEGPKWPRRHQLELGLFYNLN